MTRYLKFGELCPLHHSRFCEPCHRPKVSRKARESRRGAWKSQLVRDKLQAPRFKPASVIVPDSYSPKGYREECSPRERSRRKKVLIEQQEGICACGCNQAFDSFRDAELDHKNNSKMGGAFHDDSWDNLQVLKRACHAQKTGIPQWSKSA